MDLDFGFIFSVITGNTKQILNAGKAAEAVCIKMTKFTSGLQTESVNQKKEIY
jgi:hypothetical protein